MNSSPGLWGLLERGRSPGFKGLWESHSDFHRPSASMGLLLEPYSSCKKDPERLAPVDYHIDRRKHPHEPLPILRTYATL